MSVIITSYTSLLCRCVLPVSCVYRKSVFSLNELGQPNGAAGGGGGLAEDEEMPVAHELGEELAHTGR
jgi:hypothetical protein